MKKMDEKYWKIIREEVAQEIMIPLKLRKKLPMCDNCGKFVQYKGNKHCKWCKDLVKRWKK